ncbi:MAG: type II secretion system F family protein [Lachnospiraceae bacterium]
MKLTDYRVYKLSYSEYLIYGAVMLIFIILISYLFYHSLLPSIFLLPCSFIYYKQIAYILYRRRNERLCKQFMDSILSLSASLEAGSSMENAIWEAYLQISVIYSRNCYIAHELNAIHNQLKLSIPIEEAFSNLAARTDIEDILTFCDILKIAKRTDGNLAAIIKTTVNTISEKFHISREIRTNINGKKLEQLIMIFMPIFIIIYIRLSSPGFFNCLYHNLPGIAFVTVCLLFYGLSVLISIKITRIEV